jgi:hypothetical protein
MTAGGDDDAADADLAQDDAEDAMEDTSLLDEPEHEGDDEDEG